MTIQQAYRQLIFKLYDLYDDREAANISNMIIEHITNQRKIDRLANNSMLLSATQEEKLMQYTALLLKHMPVQYVLQEAWFAGMKLYVEPSVLIPRPETEELVEWIGKESKAGEDISSLLDIGTGSGCIALALKERFASAAIYATDISEAALQVAARNAADNLIAVHFVQADILDENEWNKFQEFDIIVSNPPYIQQSESAEMQENVMAWEPHVALFVPNDDALLFYRKIAGFGWKHLCKNGKLFFEINEMLGEDVCALLLDKGYANIELKRDLQGKNRMVKAEKIGE